MKRRFRCAWLLACAFLATSGCASNEDASATEPNSESEEDQAVAVAKQALVTTNCGDISGLNSSTWPMRGGCPSHAAQASAHGTIIGTRNWRTNLGAEVRSSPVVDASGRLYVGTQNGKINCLGANGALLWSTSIGGAFSLGVEATPAVAADGTVYVGGDDRLFALNPSGSILWSYKTNGLILSSAAIAADGTIYVGSHDGYLYALNPNGTLKWSNLIGDWLQAAPAIGVDGVIYMGSLSNKMVAIWPNGTTKWTRQLDSAGDVHGIAVAGDRVFITSLYDGFYALNRSTGAILYRRVIGDFWSGQGGVSSPAVGPDGTVYFGATNDKLYAYSPTGTLIWSYTTGGDVASSPVVDMDGRVYVGSNDNYLYALNGTTGALIFRHLVDNKIESSPFVGANGTVYVGSHDGYLYSIGSGTVGGTCGFDYPCTVASTAGVDTQIRAVQPHANLGGATSITIGYDTQENRGLFGIGAEQLLRAVHKRAKIVSAKLVLTKTTGAGSGSGTLSVHRMNQPWTGAGATWNCADDTNPSQTATTCATSNIWTMGGNPLPYGAATSTQSVAYTGATTIELDVTADITYAMTSDVDSISWLVRLSAGTGSIAVSSAESGAGAKLVISQRPETQAEAVTRRNARAAARASAIQDPLKEGYRFWLGLATSCELLRAYDGQATDPMFQVLAADLTADDRAYLAKMVADAQTLPGTTASQLLGPFAGSDPRACNSSPNFEEVAVQRQALDAAYAPRLRTNFCTSLDRSVTVSGAVLSEPYFADINYRIPGRSTTTASPAIVGIDPTVYRAEGTNQAAANAEIGPSVMINDWINNRGGLDGSEGFPGDGISPYGIFTTTPCSATASFGTDTCDHASGRLCSALVEGLEIPSSGHACVQYPVLPAGRLRLLGYNFWDPNARLFLESVETKVGVERVKGVLSSNETSSAQDSCTPANTPFYEPTLWDIPTVGGGPGTHNGTHNSLTFDIGSPDGDEPAVLGFRRLRIFNKNGSYRTRKDVNDGVEDGRVIHVCTTHETPLSDWEQIATEGTNRDCTPPSGTCPQDGLNCTAQWNSAPRELTACSGGINDPWDPPVCGETPLWFTNEGLPAIVFVEAERPTYTQRTYLERLKCIEESGCNHCGGEDEFEMLTTTLTDTAVGALSNTANDYATLKQLRDTVFTLYHNDYNHQEIKRPREKVQEFPHIRRSDTVYTNVLQREIDRDTVNRTRVWESIVAGAAGVVVQAYTENPVLAGFAAGGVAGLFELALLSVKDDDIIGMYTYRSNYWEMRDRIDLYHTPKFVEEYLATRLTPSAYRWFIPADYSAQSGFPGIGAAHPLDDYPMASDNYLLDVQCNSTSNPSLSCGSGTSCYLQHCIGSSVRQGGAPFTWSGVFNNPATQDPSYNVGFSQILLTENADSRYNALLDFVVCPEVGVATGRCATP